MIIPGSKNQCCVGYMEANGCVSGSDPMEVNIRLPPRKRLLAELKRQSCGSVPSSSVANGLSSNGFANSYLFDKLGMGYRNSKVTLEEIIEASKSAAKAAAQVAAVAKETAVEKAALAAKAAAAAKSALELVASLEEENGPRGNCVMNNKREKKVPVKLLYKRRKLNNENDEELARKLHRAMNSSPRISKNSANGNKNSGRPKNPKEIPVPNKGLICERNLSCDYENNTEGECIGSTAVAEGFQKLEGKSLSLSKVSNTKSISKHSSENRYCISEAGSVSNGKKAKFKQKKLLLSVCSSRDCEKPKAQPNSSGKNDLKIKRKDSDTPLSESKPRSEGGLPVANMQMRNAGEFVAPQCYVESKMLEPLGSNSAVSTASSMIKVDQ